MIKKLPIESFLVKFVLPQALIPMIGLAAVFTEGKDLYAGAGFKEKNHVQICVRNPNCIKGYFRVLKTVNGYSIP